ncbi:hypothetical protein N431DRAFT_529327 [Stipitochalara longipes BDJ]|nr:hypothetical protein N431DRAFT_529327 [Stipitochalara longipes BDJ]
MGHAPRCDVPLEPERYKLRACQGCARAKLKCEWPSELANSCNRCVKMDATCEPAKIVARKRRGPSKRIGKLEDKLDGILSLLNTGAKNASGTASHRPIAYSTASPETSVEHESRASLLPNPSSPPTMPSVASSMTADTPTSSRNPPQPVVTQYIEIVPGFQMTFQEADQCLYEYRSNFTPSFPFVPIPITMSAYELHEAADFLLRTILIVVAPQTLAVQRSVQKWFRQYLAQHLATDLFQLAGTLVVDLRLDKSPDQLSGRPLSFIPDALRKVKGLKRESHTLDDMRAMLGFAYLDSMVTTLYRRTRSFVFTPYLSHCCEVVLAAREHDSDKFAASIIQMQRILTRVSEVIPYPDQAENGGQTLTAALHMITAAGRKELDQIASGQPPDIIQTVLFWANYYGVLIRLYEPAIHMRPSSRLQEVRESTLRTEALSSCLQAAKDFFATYASVALDRLGDVPLIGTAYLAFAMVTSSRLMLLDDSDWDMNLAPLNFDFAGACKSLGDRFEQGDHLALASGRRRRFDNCVDASVLAAYSVKIRWIREWYMAKAAAGKRSDGGKQSLSFQIGGSASQAMQLDESALLPIELDEAFWSALLAAPGSGNWQSAQDYNIESHM